jgi:hypothetical protein
MKSSIICFFVVCAIAGCRTSALKFQCTVDAQCSGGGRCIGGFCAFTDATCASDYRYQRAGSLTAMCAPSPSVTADMSSSSAPADMAQTIDLAPLAKLTWKAEDSSATWHGVWGSSPSDVYAVGAMGRVGHRSTSGLWEYSRSITTQSTLLGIWGAGPNDIYILGDDTATTGNTISVAYGTGDGTWTNSDLGGVSFVGVDADHQYAYSQNSSGITYVGARGVWTSPGKGPPGIEGIRAGWGDGVNFYVVSVDGFYANSTATNFQWQNQLPGLNDTMRIIWGATPADIYVCGDGGGIAYSTGDGTWKVQSQATDGSICRAMWSSSATDVFAVGDAGMVLHSAGDGNWEPVAIPGIASQNIYGVWGSGPNDVFIAADGLILHGTR